MFEEIIKKLKAADELRDEVLNDLANALNKLLRDIPNDIEDCDGEYILCGFSAEDGKLTYETEYK